MTGAEGVRANIEESGVTQTLVVGNNDGVPGNCLQAALATMLRLPLNAVPHFLLFDQWNHVMDDWLIKRGWHLVIGDQTTIPDERCIVAGMSPRGVRHVCVAEHERIVWDPHPSRDGLLLIDEVWLFTERAS